MNTKQCTKCQETKTLDQFYTINKDISKRHRQTDGYDYYCKYCRNGTSIKSQVGGNKKKCTVSECEIHHYAKGMCRNHYTRLKRNGSIEYKNLVRSNDNKLRDYNLRKRFLVTIEEFNDMAKNAIHILKSEETLNEFKKNARLSALAFDLSSILPAYEDLYKSILLP